MTRETKIGLLVGLAFIIVIGILLSDHLTTATEPQQAYLPQVGGSVRSGVTIPGAGQQPQAGPAVTVAPVTPPQPVPTIQDLAPRPQPVQIVEVGPSGTALPLPPPQQQQQQSPLVQAPPVTLPPTASAPSAMPPPVSIVPPPPQQQPIAQAPVVTPQPTVITTPVPAGNGDVLAQIARQYGEDVVTPGSNTNSSAATNPPPQQPASAATPAAPDALLAGAKQYKAQDGDSLSRIASKCYGTNSKALRDAIVRANPSLQRNPELVIAGRTYVIPAVSAAAPPPPPGPSAPAAPTPAPQPAPTQVAQVVNQPEYVYKVKEGDTLWNIAAEQLGNANAVAAIKDLNQDVLKGSDVVRPNMKLRLPAKPIAAAN